MSNGKSPTLWIYDHAPTRWVIVGVFVVAWFLAIVFLFSDIVKVLVARPWWEDFIVVLATVAVPILAYLELLHSAEANRLRDEANEERRKANRLTEQNAQLSAELDAERNKHLAQIAINTARPGVGNEKYLNDANPIKIPPDDSTSVGCLWFFLPEPTLCANAGLQTQGPENRFGNLNCRLTVTDSNGISASENFECHEA